MKPILSFILSILMMYNGCAAVNYAPQKFEQKCFITDSKQEINYWLYTPKNAKENLPLIVYLHGSHSQGDDLNLVLEEEFCKKISNGEYEELSAYVIIPQLPSGFKSWIAVQAYIKQLIDSVKEEYSVNKQNISLMGYSMGGTEVYNMAMAYPDFFSKVVPISGSVRNAEESAEKLSKTSVWAFVGENDTIVRPDSSKKLAETLISKGKNAKITVFSGADHISVPLLVFSEYKTELINFLISV